MYTSHYNMYRTSLISRPHTHTHNQVKSEKPEPILGVICATLCIAESAFKKRFADYQALLERGQVMNAELLSNVVDVELIYSGVKYSLRASRVQPTSTLSPTHPPTHTHPHTLMYTLTHTHTHTPHSVCTADE